MVLASNARIPDLAEPTAAYEARRDHLAWRDAPGSSSDFDAANDTSGCHAARLAASQNAKQGRIDDDAIREWIAESAFNETRSI